MNRIDNPFEFKCNPKTTLLRNQTDNISRLGAWLWTIQGDPKTQDGMECNI